MKEVTLFRIPLSASGKTCTGGKYFFTGAILSLDPDGPNGDHVPVPIAAKLLASVTYDGGGDGYDGCGSGYDEDEFRLGFDWRSIDRLPEDEEDGDEDEELQQQLPVLSHALLQAPVDAPTK